MSGPTSPDDDYMSAEALLDSLFPKIDLYGPPPTEQELQQNPEIIPPEMKAGGREDPRWRARRSDRTLLRAMPAPGHRGAAPAILRGAPG